MGRKTPMVLIPAKRGWKMAASLPMWDEVETVKRVELSLRAGDQQLLERPRNNSVKKMGHSTLKRGPKQASQRMSGCNTCTAKS
jgi:hypothetical protein